MHEIQKKLIEAQKKHDFSELTLREIGNLVGISHPQRVQHHLDQLYKKGFLTPRKTLNVVESIKTARKSQPDVIKIPIIGKANCGQPCVLAEERIEGYLTVSSSLLIKKRHIFALKAEGDSMNQANIKGENIEENDYIIVDYNNKDPKNNDYVLSIINDCANIKKYLKRRNNNQILLVSESSEDYPPIVVDANDRFMINGKVIQIIKQ